MQNFMKTILSGVKTWTHGEIHKSTADWSQSDPNADNYVKNRTHWEEEVEISIVPKQQIPAIYPYASFDSNYCFDPEEGVTYVITFNGIRYELTAWYHEQWGCNVVGNRLYIDGVDNGSNVPFAFDGYGINAPYGVYTMSISILVDGIETEIMEEQTVYNVWEQPLGEFPLELGSVYSVNLDGNIYEFTATEHPDFSAVRIGDMTQYPFEMLYVDEYLFLDSTVSGIHTISLTDVTNNTQIIAKEYIGDCASCDNIDIFNLQADQTYTVTWDDEIYSCIAKDIGDCVFIGNPIYAYLNDWNIPYKNNTNEPFFIATDKSYNWLEMLLDYGKSHTVSISTTKTTVHKLDSKYLNLPENLATMDDVEEVRNYADSAYDAANKKMDKKNPSGTGSFSMNRKPDTTIGSHSHAEGYHTTAANPCSHAEGSSTIARGDCAHAEGALTAAYGSDSHAEGYSTKAIGMYSHSEGYHTEAVGSSQHVQGEWNIPDQDDGLTVGRTLHAHIVGNGTSTTRSNAHTLDWDGNAWFAGDVYVGSTSGVNKDEGSKKLATEDFVNTSVANLVNSAPETLDTLGEIASALAENEDIVETLNQAISNKVDKNDLPKIATDDDVFNLLLETNIIEPVASNNGIFTDRKGNIFCL